MKMIYLLFTAFALVVMIPNVEAGCSYTFYFALIDDEGNVLENLPTNYFPAHGSYDVDLGDGQYLRATISFASCIGGHFDVYRDGVLFENGLEVMDRCHGLPHFQEITSGRLKGMVIWPYPARARSM